MEPTNSKKRAREDKIPSFFELVRNTTKEDDEEGCPPLCWGDEDDPAVFSDWKIAVTTTASTTTESSSVDEFLQRTYTVHKAILGLGPHKSKYFLRLFQNDTLAESKDSTSRIKLTPMEAEAFPMMLNFMYIHPREVKRYKFLFHAIFTTKIKSSESHGKDITPSKIVPVALKHLADYFEIPSLLKFVNDYIEEDVDEDNLEEYVTAANMYNFEEIYDKVENVAAINWQSLFISKDGKELTTMPKFMELLPVERQRRIFLKSLWQAKENPPGED